MLALFVDRRPSFHPDGLGSLPLGPAISTLGHPWRNPKKTTPIFFDASIREEHGVEVILSDEPIEDGSTITDHARVMPDALTMEVILSENKDRAISPLITAARTLSPIGNWRTLVALAKGRRPFDVVTSLTSYESMMIVRLGTPRTVDTTHALLVSVYLRKVQLVTVDQVSNMTEEAGNLAAPEVDVGMQATGEVPPAVSLGTAFTGGGLGV